MRTFGGKVCDRREVAGRRMVDVQRSAFSENPIRISDLWRPPRNHGPGRSICASRRKALPAEIRRGRRANSAMCGLLPIVGIRTREKIGSSRKLVRLAAVYIDDLNQRNLSILRHRLDSASRHEAVGQPNIAGCRRKACRRLQCIDKPRLEFCLFQEIRRPLTANDSLPDRCHSFCQKRGLPPSHKNLLLEASPLHHSLP